MRLFGIYLNDHLVGATGGGELARRVARSSLIPPTPVLQRLSAGSAGGGFPAAEGLAAFEAQGLGQAGNPGTDRAWSSL